MCSCVFVVDHCFFSELRLGQVQQQVSDGQELKDSLGLMVKLETVCAVLVVVSLQCHLYKAGGEPVGKHKMKAESSQLLDSLTSERSF